MQTETLIALLIIIFIVVCAALVLLRFIFHLLEMRKINNILKYYHKKIDEKFESKKCER